MSDITTSASYSVGNKSYSNNGFSGLISGMDTDSLVQKLLTGDQTKLDKQEQAKQVLEWKQDMYRDVISSVQKFQSTYFDTAFDSTLKTNLTNPDFFNAMTSTVTGNAGAVTVNSSSSNANIGSISVSVSQLATAAKIVGKPLVDANANKIASNSVDFAKLDTGERFSFNIALNGISKQITVDPSKFNNDAKAALADSIATTFGGTADANGVTGGYVNLTFQKDANGNADNTFTLSPSDVSSEIVVTGMDALNVGITPGTTSKLNMTATLKDFLNDNSTTDLSNSYVNFQINHTAITATANDTLYDLMDRINNSDAGVTIQYNSFSDTFQMESKDTGEHFGIQIDTSSSPQAEKLFEKIFGSDNGNGTFGSYTQGTDAKATVTIGGTPTTVTRSSNTFSVDGINLTLNQKTEAGAPATISTKRDVDNVVKTMQQFVTDYNTMVLKLRSYTDADATYKNYPPLTDDQKKDMKDSEITSWTKKAQEGLLHNDENVTAFLQQMRSVLYEKPDGSKYALYDIGIDTSAFTSGDTTSLGTLTFDETAFRNALASDPESVQKLFTTELDGATKIGGIARMMNAVCDSAVKVSISSPGSLVQMAGVKEKAWSSKNNDIYLQLQGIEDKISDLKDKYDDDRDRYWKKFNDMETTLSNFSTQSGWLTSQFGGM